MHIAIKELIPIMIATLVWGQLWSGGRVIAHCDNTAVVSVLNSRYSQDKMLMQMLRGLFFIEAYFQFQLSAVHLPGIHNGLADDLSRNRLSFLLRKRGGSTDSTPSPIPVSLLQWLLNPKLEWTSPSWMEQFSSIVQKV